MKTSIFKKMAFALLFVLMFSSMSFATNGDLGGETYDGSSSKPYQISDAADLNAFAKLVNDGVQTGASAVLTQDIDMNQGKTVLDGNGDLYNNGEGLETWTPIGTDEHSYTGTFDGNGYTIRGLYFNDENTNYVGLFGYISGSTAKVQNVGVVDSYFNGDSEVGGVVGFNYDGSTVSNVYNTGSVNGTGNDVGGVVGFNGDGSTVSNVYNTGSVSGSGNAVGGVVGFSFNGTVSNAYNTGSVSGDSEVGGVVGMNDNGIVSNVYYNTGTYYGRAVGFGEAGTNVGGKTTAELASLVVESAFPQDADIQNPWTAGDIEGSVCKLPYLTGLGNQPQIEVVSVTINDINGNAELKTVTIPSGSRLSLAGVQMEDYGVFSLYKKVDDEFVEWNFEDGVKNDIELWAKYIRVVDGVYQISNADELLGFASIVNSGETDIDGKLTADICLNACEEVDKPLLEQIAEKGEGNLTPSTFNQWTPIGTEEKQFVGKFDGNGKTVRGLYFNDENAGYVGLFGYVGENGVVQNVGVVDSYLRGFWAVGGVVGFNGSGTVSNVYNTGSVNGTGGSVGGVVGYNVDGSVSNVYNTGSVSGYYEVGGVVGGNYSGGTVSNVYNTGSVSGSGNVGGVVGFNYYGTVSNVYNTGVVSGDSEVGGVVGGMDGGDINKAYYDNQTCNNCNSYGTGKPLAELATLTIGSKADADFPLLEGEMESPWAKGIYYDKATGKLANSELPYLKSLPKPQDVEMEFNVKDNVIQISTAEDLKNFAKLVNEYHITDVDAELTTNLTVNSNLLGEGNKNVEDDGTFNWEAYRTAHNWNEPESWSPIGTGENPYQGTFNGNNKTVSGVFNSDASSDVGFFGRVGENGVVKNVGVVDSYINCNMYCGGIVGENDGSVSGVSYAGVVNGEEDVGGIIGKNNGGASVRNVYKTGAVYGSNLVGGIVGDNGASINNAFNMGTVSGSDNVGGVAGQNSGSVSKAYYNTDFYAGNGIGMSYGLTEDVLGKSTADLAALDVSEAFPQNEGEENPWANDISYDKATGKLTSTLPYLKNFPVVPDAETILSFTVASGVIQISTAEDLKNFARLVNEFGITDANAELTTSITLNSNLLGENNANVYAETGEYKGSAPANVWTPIGTDEHPYTGTFDGNGHTIRGLYFNDERTNYVGLFGYIYGSNAIVQNVGVVDSYFKGDSYVGGVVGFNNKGTVSNVYNTGAVSGGTFVGGVVGYNNSGSTVSNVYNTGSVSGYSEVGGVVGYNGEGTVSNVYNTGSVSGTGYYHVGGVVGYNDEGTVSNVYNTGSVSGSGDDVGGVVGYSFNGTVSNVYNTGSVSGTSLVGGVVGYNDEGTVSNVYNTGIVSGTSIVGGVVGFNDGTVRNGFFNTEVTCENCYVVDGTTGKLSGEFADGTVARLLHDWCEKEDGSDECKEGGLNGSVWGQDLAAENSLPDFSGVVGFKYGSITFFNLNDGVADSASIDATAKDPVSIPENIAVSKHVTFKRPFAVGYSTMMLPFSVSEENMPAELEFYSFDKVEEIDGKYTASYISVTGLNAHTPYIVKNSGKDALSQVTFEGEFTLGTSGMPPPNSSSSAWKFNGTYEYKTWEEGDEGLGKTYGFAGSAGNDPKIVGQFAKVGAGAYIYPMRAYLEYTAPAPAGRPAANDAAAKVAGKANTVAALPDEIEVVIVNKDETTGEQTTKVIGTINTRTGEFKFANDRWFDLQGRYLGNKKPTQKGAYYNNGKKVIVK